MADNTDTAKLTLKGKTKEFKPDWTKYDVIVLNYVGESWPDETKAGFEKYMKEKIHYYKYVWEIFDARIYIHNMWLTK